MTLGERIKKLRKALDLTQQKFAEQIGTTQNVLANYESGRRNPSASAFNNICKTFNINETWLRTGEGEMFLQRSREDEIAAFLSDLRGGPDFRQKFISVLSRMTEDEWAILEKKVLELAQEFQKEKEEKQQESDAEKAANLYLESNRSEKGPDAPVSSVKESDAV